MRTNSRQTMWVSIAGVLAVTAYATFAAVQILVLNPLAAAPGLSLDEVHAEVSAAGEDLTPGRVLILLGIGVAMALGVAVVSIVAKAPPIVPGMSYLALLMLGAPGYFVASFGPGMALADSFMISGADASPWARPLYGVSALAALAVLAVSLVFARGSRGLRGEA